MKVYMLVQQELYTKLLNEQPSNSTTSILQINALIVYVNLSCSWLLWSSAVFPHPLAACHGSSISFRKPHVFSPSPLVLVSELIHS